MTASKPRHLRRPHGKKLHHHLTAAERRAAEKRRKAWETQKCSASIVAQNGILGGRPRLDKTRLDVEWFAANRDMPPQWWAKYYGDLGLEAILFMFAVVDAVELGLRAARRNQ